MRVIITMISKIQESDKIINRIWDLLILPTTARNTADNYKMYDVVFHFNDKCCRLDIKINTTFDLPLTIIIDLITPYRTLFVLKQHISPIKSSANKPKLLKSL